MNYDEISSGDGQGFALSIRELIPIPKMATPFWESQNLTGFGV
ncbi:hypothetical protein FEV09_11850 [Pseudanabaena catenata USMAC16]|uniref:Uncharacterized protein n=1 Tax=Pseudanabaena catenata USMAC16 TaxID=1855837 RepID=A0A9X4RHT7_9CYAN|nr:hypothetical protein [Pseudanabaena catenata]MDG3495253.1 hypothetical protein [Pseudanabaena catenata USMAC16]